MQKTINVVVSLLLSLNISAQTIKGKITGEHSEPLVGAKVQVSKLLTETTTDEKGLFEINLIDTAGIILVISYTDYQTETININGRNLIDVKLKHQKQLKGIVVRGSKESQYISSLNPIKTEIISNKELRKGACCDLAGCFGTNASVQASTTNIITNAQELRILGLSGVYNQVLLDGFPMIQGLTYTYGISNIPGPLVENIYVSKGANSVLQGFESISGQINVETKEPDKADKLFLNLYINSFLEKQANAYYAFKKKKWSYLIAFHSVQPAKVTDRDNDSFLDLPRVTRYELYNKIKYGNEKDFGWSSQIGIRYVNEQRIGGQIYFNPKTDKGSAYVYGQAVNINQPELWNKTAYRFNDTKRLVLFASTYFQKQSSWYGTTLYEGNQKAVNTSLQYEWIYGDESNLKTGVSYRYFDLQEQISFSQNPLNHSYAGNYGKSEHIPGVFAENTLYFGDDKFTWITGARLDHHNVFGYYFTPRTLLKYAPFEKTTIRGSVGLGWRTANIFSENSNLLSSQRDIVFTEPLKPEKAINSGISLVQGFERTNLTGTFSADYYHTQFQNQIFPDYNTDPTKAYIGNFTGISVSNGVQIEGSIKFYKRLDIKVAYNYLNVYRIKNTQKQILPFNSKDKVLTTLSYQPLSNKWHFDANIHWYGAQQLPDTRANPVAYQRPLQSEPYTTVNAQFTYNFKKIQIYLGCENIFDFRQRQPIISWQNPFSQYFDVSSVWGPTRGREVYLGMRFKIEK